MSILIIDAHFRIISKNIVVHLRLSGNFHVDSAPDHDDPNDEPDKYDDDNTDEPCWPPINYN